MPPPVEVLLRAVGFRTESVLRIEEVDEGDDIAVLRYARRRRMIVLCFDMHENQPTKLAWNTEIVRRGGRAIQIDGGPGQSPDEAAGKVLMHYAQWSWQFREHLHGVATLTRAHSNFADKATLKRRTPEPRSERDWEIQLTALAGRKRRPGPGRRRRPNPQGPSLPGL